MESKKDVLRTSAATEEEDDDDDDCIILEGDPYATLIDNNLNQPESDDLIVVRENGEVACRDYPHPRHLCAAFPFASTSHFEHCRQCHCYVCDSPAPCANWGTGTYVTDHCHSTDKEQTWKVKRNCHRLYGGNASTPIPQSPMNCPAQTFQTQSTGDGDRRQVLYDRAEISRIINRLYGGNASTPIPQSPINCPAQTFQTQSTGDGDWRQALYDQAQISRAIRKKLSQCSGEEEGFAHIDFATNRQDSLPGYCNGAQPCNDPPCSLPYNSHESQNYQTTDKEQTWKVKRHHKYGKNASTPIPQSPINRPAQTFQTRSSGIKFATNPQGSLPNYSNGAQRHNDAPSSLPHQSYQPQDYTNPAYTMHPYSYGYQYYTNPAYTMHHYSYGYQDYTDPQYSKAHYSNVSQGCTNPLSSVPYQNYGFQGNNNSPYSSRNDASYYGSEDYINPPQNLPNGSQGCTNSQFNPPDYSYEPQGYTNPTCSLPNYSYRSPGYTNYRC